MYRGLACVLLTAALAACAQGAQHAGKNCFHRHDFESDIGYCQAVRSGTTLHISGSVGVGPMPDAMRMAYAELKATLEANGLTFHDVVKENVYTTDIDAFIKAKEIRKTYYGADFPAATWVQVQRLYEPTDVVEVELTARIR